MNVPFLTTFFDHSTSLQITWLILHFLWQGLVIALAVLIFNMLAARKSPKLRYGIAVVGMVAMIASVVTTWFLLQPDNPAIGTSVISVPVNIGPALEFDASLAMIDVEPTSEPKSQLEVWAPAAMAIYVIGVACMLLRLLFSAIGVGRLRITSKSAGSELVARVSHLSEQIGLRMNSTLKTCERVVVPFVAGVIKPAILLPSLVATGMTQPELDAILLHELAHVRRGDLLVNFLQRIVESLLFFHPGVWYVSRVITVEREICCDDIVLGHCSQKVYASALIRLAEACGNNSAEIEPIAALAATGARPSQLKRRVMRILGVKPTPQFHKPGFGVLSACIIAATISAVHLQAQTETHDSNVTGQEEADGVEPFSLGGIGLGDVEKAAPLTISFDEDGKIAGFSVNNARSMQWLTAILQNLTDKQSVVITSMNVRRNQSGLTMTVQGRNLDLAAIQSAVRKADASRVEALTRKREDDRNRKQIGAEAASALGKLRSESLGDVMIVRGEKMNETIAKSIVDEFKAKALNPEGDLGFLGPVRIEAMGDVIMLRGSQQDLDRVVKIIQEVDGMDGNSANSVPAADNANISISSLEATKQEAPNATAEAKTPGAPQQASEPNMSGPIRFEIFGEDQFNIRGAKEDVDRVMKHIEKDWDKNKPARKSPNAHTPDDDSEPVLTDPVRFEFLEGTDIFIVRGKKEDVDRIMKAMGAKSHPDDAKPENAEGDKYKPARNDAGQLNFESPSEDAKGQINEVDDQPLFVAYRLTNVIAAEVAEVLREAFIDLISSDSQQKPIIKADVENNRILVRATRKTREAILQYLQVIDIAARSDSDALGAEARKQKTLQSGEHISASEAKLKAKERTIKVYRLQYVSAELVAKVIGRMFGDAEDRPAIHTEPTRNRLIAWARPQQHWQIEELLRQLDAGAKTTEARHILGVVIAPVPNGQPGVLVRAVVSGTLAESAGIRVGDILLRYDDEVVTTENLPKVVQPRKNNSPKLTIDRNGKVIVIQTNAEPTLEHEIRIRLLREELDRRAKQLQSLTKPGSSSDRDNTFREIVELKNQILELEAKDQRLKVADDSHLLHDSTLQDQLRFPVEIERGMMLDAVKNNHVR